MTENAKRWRQVPWFRIGAEAVAIIDPTFSNRVHNQWWALRGFHGCLERAKQTAEDVMGITREDQQESLRPLPSLPTPYSQPMILLGR